jgi:hypothetical protein
MDDLEIIYHDYNFKISKKTGDSDIVFLCFSGVGMQIGGIEIQKEEFNKATAGATSIFIIDYNRQWGNIDWKHLNKIIYPHIANKRVFSIGNSMGGFCAILASRHFLIEKVIAFVPQYSAHKSVVPNETRWAIQRENIKKWDYISLDGSFNDNTEYHIFYGNDLQDSMHRELFPKQDNIIMNVYEGDHYLVKDLKDKGLLYGLISDIVNQDSL